MNRRELLVGIVGAPALAGVTDVAGERNDLTPISEMPDYCAVAEDREAAVCGWASSHVEEAQIELTGGDRQDAEAAKAELETALELLEQELAD